MGHPDRWNDKTIILYDELSRGLKNGDNEPHNFQTLQKNIQW